MPNHVFHQIMFNSELTDLQEQKLKEIANTKGGLCEYYLPMPEEIRNTTSPPNIVSENEYFLFIKEKTQRENSSGDENSDTYSSKPITLRIQKELIEKYGTDNWYDWAYMNWGTKWGCYENEFDTDRLSFSTAWSPMEMDIIYQFSLDFPSFTWHWEEEQGYGATMIFVDGEIVEEDSYDCFEWTSVGEYTDENNITWDILHTNGREESLSTEKVNKGFYTDYTFSHHSYLGEVLSDEILSRLNTYNKSTVAILKDYEK